MSQELQLSIRQQNLELKFDFFFHFGLLLCICCLIRKLLLLIHPWGPFDYTLFLNMSIFTFNYWFQNSLNSAFKPFPSTIYIRGGLLPLLQRGSHFNRSYAPLGPPGAWPPGNKGTRCIEMAIMYLHSSESRQPGGKGTGWQENNPIFYFPALSHTPLPPENRPERSSEKSFESLCTKVTRNHKVQLLFIWRGRVCREPQRTPVVFVAYHMK